MVQNPFQVFSSDKKIYRPQEIQELLERIVPYVTWKKTNKKIEYALFPCSFDIETSSFYDNGEKVAIMYEWTLGLYGLVIVGRTWQEFLAVCREIEQFFGLWESRRLLIYVHNLGYEFQFIRKHFQWEKVFSIEQRKPIYAVTTSGFEFRCSFLLSGYNLEKVGKDLKKYKVQKLVGDLDYKLLRHSATPLTDKEVGYCVNDVKVVMCYIQESAENAGGLLKLPLTKTGYVRNFCRGKCFTEPGKKRSYKRMRYREQITNLVLELPEYRQLKRAFQGGFTHANPFYSGKVIQDVTSYDFTSSYPAVMLSEKFPMSRAEEVEINDRKTFEHNLNCYCCLFDLEIHGLESTVFFDSYISLSRCWNVRNAVVNNGRIVSADSLCISLTEQDYMIIEKMYTWREIGISNFRRYKRGYLPTDFVKAILELYEQKTTLKGVEGKEIEYLHSKEMLNSCYGMAVTDIVRDEITYTDQWGIELADQDEELKKYNTSSNRFLFYPWGVWVTAYARRNLFTGILEFRDDYVYSDTDSVKVIYAEKHLDYIQKYNEIITEQLREAMEFHKIPPERTAPKTIKGVSKPLGVWDFDGHFSRFKTLGAKRYLVEYSQDERNKGDKGKISLTVSGINKKVCVPYLLETYGDRIFESFCNQLYIPKGKSGKMTHTYIDECRSGRVKDYRGVWADYEEESAVHLEDSDYSLSLAREYVDYIKSLTL